MRFGWSGDVAGDPLDLAVGVAMRGTGGALSFKLIEEGLWQAPANARWAICGEIPEIWRGEASVRLLDT